MSFTLVSAGVIELAQISLGKVVSVNGLKFIKISKDKYMMITEWPKDFVPESMQDFAARNGCADYLVPDNPFDFTAVGELRDERDGHIYEIRKFKDGKCWMVDNLRYGGTTTVDGNVDACENKITVTDHGMNTGTANPAWYDENGNPMYGDCIDPSNPSIPANYNTGTQTWNTCISKTDCGYKYNWQAAIQQPNCNYNNGSCSFTTPTTTSNFVKGICPAGWHVPSGGEVDSVNSEFVKLDLAVGGNGGNNQSGNSWRYFWHAYGGAGWKFYPSGWVSDLDNSGWGGAYHNSWDTYGQRDHWWSATPESATNAYHARAHGADYYAARAHYKWSGLSIRCVED